MEEVFRMYAMSDGNPNAEPAELDSDHEEDFEEDDEVETSSILTSSDDDEVVAEETVIVVAEVPAPQSRPRRRPQRSARRLRRRRPLPRRLQQRRLLPRRLAAEEGSQQRRPRKEGCSQEGSREKGCGQEGRKEVRRKEEQHWREGRKGQGQEGRGSQSAPAKPPNEVKSWPLRKQQRRRPPRRQLRRKLLPRRLRRRRHLRRRQLPRRLLQRRQRKEGSCEEGNQVAAATRNIKASKRARLTPGFFASAIRGCAYFFSSCKRRPALLREWCDGSTLVHTFTILPLGLMRKVLRLAMVTPFRNGPASRTRSTTLCSGSASRWKVRPSLVQNCLWLSAVVHAHAQDDGILGLKLGQVVLEVVGLDGAAGGHVLGIEVEHHPLAAKALRAKSGCRPAREA